MVKDKPFKRFDVVLVLAALGLTAIGLTAVYSTGGGYYFSLQIFYLYIAIAGLIILCFFNYRVLNLGHWVIYWAVMMLLAYLLKDSGNGQDAARWVKIGSKQFQPSEFAKIAVALGVAHLLTLKWNKLDIIFFVILGLLYIAAPWLAASKIPALRSPVFYFAFFFFDIVTGLWIWRVIFTVNEGNIGTIDSIAIALLYLGIPTVLIFLQPDLGTALVFAAIFFGALFIGAERFNSLDKFVFSLLGAAGIFGPWALVIFKPYFRNSYWIGTAVFFTVVSAALIWRLWKGKQIWRSLDISALIFLIAAFVVTAAIIVGPKALKPYQIRRLTAFMDPDADPKGANYHLNQSMIAIGSGGLWGKGLFLGTQSQLEFVPEQHTDFIFSAIAEEMGFAGSLTLLGLFAVLIWRGINIALKCDDKFGAFLAVAVISIVIFHVVINVGMTMGLMPVTGLPLPFISYGGTSLITNFAIVGLLESIAIHGRNDEGYGI